MPTSITLAESAKLVNDDLVAGVIRDVITVNPAFEFMPFIGTEGEAYVYNRETTLGDVESIAVGSAISANAAAGFTQVTTTLKTLIGKAAVNGLIQSTRSNPTNQLMTQISSKAYNLGRTYQNLMINGDSGTTATEFDGLLTLVDAEQTVGATDANGDQFDIEMLDEVLAEVTAKGGMVDFVMMNIRELNAYKKALRALGGADMEMVRLANGNTVLGYNGVPIFRNDYIPIDQTQGTATDATSIIAGVWEDGGNNGIAGVTSANDSGIIVTNPAQSEDYDELYSHIKWYCSLAVHSRRALAVRSGITPSGTAR